MQAAIIMGEKKCFQLIIQKMFPTNNTVLSLNTKGIMNMLITWHSATQVDRNRSHECIYCNTALRYSTFHKGQTQRQACFELKSL